ncbi:MAG: SusC/RagA family TonB-linked outer membrane protein, partial [Bacteroidetes bacterium]
MSSIAYAQDKTIKGKVTSDDQFLPEGIPGVTVLVKGMGVGTSTDMNGEYSIKVPADASTLIFSFIGYQNQEIAIGTQTSINVMLVADVRSLEEVVVIGYGTSTKKELTGAVSVVDGKSIEKINPIRIENA